MVGIPGRSTGCNTCRKRRVKCDDAKPVCQRCTRAGIRCLGYSRATTWYHTVYAPLAAVQALRLRGRNSVPAELSLVAFKDDLCMAYLFSNFVWRAYGAGWLDEAAQGKLGGLALDTAAALAHMTFGRENHLAEIETRGSLTYGKCLRTLAGELGRGVPALARQGQELMVPILVLLMHASANTDQAGALFHLKGVAKLLYLCGPQAFQRQPFLNAFEACRSTMIITGLVSRRRVFLEDENWRTVPWALNPGAKSDQSRLLDILVTIPGMLEDHAVLDQLLTAQTSSRHDSQASTNPLPTQPPAPQVPDSVTTASPAPFNTTDPSPLRASLLSRLTAQLTSLYNWRWHWQAAHGNEVSTDRTRSRGSSPPSATPAHPITPTSLPSTPRHPAPLRFTRFGAAADVMLYNTVLIWLLGLLWKLEPIRGAEVVERCAHEAMLASTRAAAAGGTVNNDNHSNNNTSDSGRSAPAPRATPPFDPLRRPGAAVGIRDPAVEICRAFEWLSRHHSGGGEQTCMYLFPVGVALSVLDGEPEARAWVRALLDRSVVTSSYARYSGGGGQQASGQGGRGDGEGDGEGAPGASRGRQRQHVAGFGFYVTKEALDPSSVRGRPEFGVDVGGMAPESY